MTTTKEMIISMAQSENKDAIHFYVLLAESIDNLKKEIDELKKDE